MKRIVLIRHGQSLWNKENRFTGWANVDLTEKGIEEAENAGKLLASSDFRFTKAYTSMLQRAIKTMNIILDEMSLDWIPVEKSWFLNGRHYGALEGLNKQETIDKYGREQVQLWRRSYDVAPPKLDKNDPRSPLLCSKYSFIPENQVPLGESLKEASTRILPYWKNTILTSLKEHSEILVTAHGNTLRAIIKEIRGLSDKEIKTIELPTATPYVFEFDDNLDYVQDYLVKGD